MSNPKFEYVSNEKEINFPDVKKNLLIGNRYKRYTRSYIKFQEFLAIIGGFMKIILSVFNIVLMLAKTYLIDLHIIQR